MNNSRHIDDKLPEDKLLKEAMQAPDSLTEIEVDELEEVSGGGDGTALGTGRN